MWWVALAAMMMFAGCTSVPTSFDPVNPIPAAQFSHKIFDEMLVEYVQDGVVDYPRIQADNRLPLYLTQLDRSDPNAFSTRHEQLAFWINAYNAFAIKGILDRYSPMTLVGRYRYFISQHYSVGGQRINLYDLEREVLIPEFGEPRIHFAIVCASTSCPKLQSRAFMPTELEEQLELSARGFINDLTRNRFDRGRKIAYLSKIFDWFEEDFVAHSGSLLDYVKRYLADPELVRDLETTTYSVQFLEYDWHLNGQPLVNITRAD